MIGTGCLSVFLFLPVLFLSVTHRLSLKCKKGVAVNEITKLRIVLIHIHGLFRSHDLELGRDSDTGGQTKYVYELATSLSVHPSVEEVVVLTRQIIDPRVSDDYALPEENINDKVRIVRISSGPRRYLKKESLWPYMDTFVDRSLNYFRRIGRLPHIIHGHYADGGYVASQLARLLRIPCVFTGHSLGRIKRQRLLDKGKSPEKIESLYKFTQRIEAEEISLDTASVVITSTLQEVEEQYAVYEQYQPGNMEVIPPGLDLSSFKPPDFSEFPQQIFKDIGRFLSDPHKPVILSLARPDERKNTSMLIKVYGESPELQKRANLVIIAGCREGLELLPSAQKKEFYKYISLIDQYDLYGKVAYPKHHKAQEVPLLYRWAASLKGVFINPALTEPFGLTLLESAASGLPVVATNDGGPRDILAVCENGLLVDPLNQEEIEKALLRFLSDEKFWKKSSGKGILASNEYYNWERHISKYMRDITELLEGQKPQRYTIPRPVKALPNIKRLIITDIDNTLTGDEEALGRFVHLVKNIPDHIGFGVATGRRKEAALQFLKDLGVPRPLLLISSVGTEIYYGEELVEDSSWRQQINDKSWKPGEIRSTLKGVEGLWLQEPEFQSDFKISYKLDPSKGLTAPKIRSLLRHNKLKAKVILSMSIFLDIIPIRAGDGMAVRQLSFRWGIPWENILIVGDCGNDEEMLKGETLGVVVSNYSPELARIQNYPRVYFSEKSYADGIIDGIEYYNFLDDIRIPNDFRKQ